MKKSLMLLLAAMGCTLAISQIAFAGVWEQDSFGWRYKEDDGRYVKNTQVWLDGDQDNLYQKFDFDENGYCYMNRVGHGNQEYNEKGEWVYKGVVQTIRRKTEKYENWLDILLQSNAMLGQPYNKVQATYGNPQSCYFNDLLWMTATYTLERSPLYYRFTYRADTGPEKCDFIDTDNDFVPEGITIRDLKNALGVDVYCSHSSIYTNGTFKSESYSYFFNYGPNSWTFSVKDGKESLDVPLQFTSLSIFPFNNEYQTGVVSDTRDCVIGLYDVHTLLK